MGLIQVEVNIKKGGAPEVFIQAERQIGRCVKLCKKEVIN
jgi:hypothetical protein